jgi:hypothetical protein
VVDDKGKYIMESTETKIINTACPLPMEVLKEYFQDKDNTSFLISYKDSKLNADALMVYLSNLNLDADFDDETYGNRDALKELVVAYMSSTTALIHNDQMAREALAICHQHRGVKSIDLEGEFYTYQEDLGDAADFIAENLDTVERWCTMLDSAGVYNMHIMNDPEFNDWIAETFETIDDPDYVGINYVNVFRNEEIGYYIGDPVPTRNPKYFENQFNEYRFKGKNMFEYFNVEQNVLSVQSQVIATQHWDEIVPDDMK